MIADDLEQLDDGQLAVAVPGDQLALIPHPGPLSAAPDDEAAEDAPLVLAGQTELDGV